VAAPTRASPRREIDMKRIVLALMLSTLIGPGAHAAHGASDYVLHGHVMIGDVAVLTTLGSTVQGCDPFAPWQGVDSFLVRLPDGSDGHNVTLEWDGHPLNDFDVFFFDADCEPFAYDAMQTFDNPETGVVPEGAIWAEVDLFNGADAGFTLTVEDVLP
jgi:hypothetical protein